MLSGITICYLRTEFETLQRADRELPRRNARKPLQKDRTVNDSTDTNDPRLDALTNWLAGIPDVAGLPPMPASGDASFRRYFRLRRDSQSWIVMDAPPSMEDSRAFVEVAGLLHSMSLNVPKILAADLDDGFLLMTDLGSRQYLGALESDPAAAEKMYGDAIDVLLCLQRQGVRFMENLPVYDETLLRFEVSLFRDFLCGRHLGIVFSKAEETCWQSIGDLLIESALDQPSVFVHRDYHSRNLMLTETNNPGILDFQDAVKGPLTYDLVSLLKDCYIRLPDDAIKTRAMRFYDGLDERNVAGLERDDFWRKFELMGVQRHLKAAGIFARLLHRDGKGGYMQDVPRTLRYIVDVAPNYPALEFLSRLIEERCLPRLADCA